MRSVPAIFGCLLFFLACSVAQAAPAGAKSPEGPAGPVDIRSDRLVVEKKAHRAVFSGKVRLVQKDLIILCDKLVVSYSDDKSEPGRITRMVFSGEVSIEQQDRKGHCGRADYDRTVGLIICTGKPWVVEGKSRVEGERIEYHLSRDEVRVIRPRAVIQLPADDNPKSGRTK